MWSLSKLPQISFFLLHSFRDRRFALTVDLSNSAYNFVLYLLRTFTFPLKRSTSQLLFGTSKLPALLPLRLQP